MFGEDGAPGWQITLSWFRKEFFALYLYLSSGCYNKVPQTGQLNQQKSMSHSSGGWKSRAQVSALWSSWWRLAFQLAGDCILISQRAERKQVHMSLLTRALIPFMKATPSWPNYPKGSTSWLPSYWGLGFQQMTLRDHKHSVQSNFQLFCKFALVWKNIIKNASWLQFKVDLIGVGLSVVCRI